MNITAEARTQRIWRERCGEPKLDSFPIRCRRDLSHGSPHAGMSGTGKCITWPGEGNPVSAQIGGNGGYRCWCVPGHRWLQRDRCECGRSFTEWEPWSTHAERHRKQVTS